MEKKEDYEKLYDMLLGYEQEIHKKNQKRIRIGLRCQMLRQMQKPSAII